MQLKMLSRLHFLRLFLGVVFLVIPAITSAQTLELSARAAIVIDHNSGLVLFEKDADRALPPASMSKLMTLYMVFEALRDERLSLETILPVSQHAMNYGGSSMFLDTRDRVSVQDLIMGIVVLSGNDACAVLAEALSPDGTESGFAREMTERSRELGMLNSNFMNSNGWPEDGHVMSTRDLAILAERIISDFPEHYGLFSTLEFEFDGRAPANTRNRNPLLRLGIGADGLKTGHTREAGYGLVGSAEQNDRRITFVLTGIETERGRAEEAERVVNWAFRQFSEVEPFAPNSELAQADIFMGKNNSIAIGPTQSPPKILLAANSPFEAEIVYESPLRAPVEAGSPVGELIIRQPNLADQRFPLISLETVEKGGIFARVGAAARYLAPGLLGKGSSDPVKAELPE